jgi:hypothetical protein
MRFLDTSAFAAPVSRQDHSALIAEIAARVVARHLALPAVLFLESIKPLNRLAGQALLCLAPLCGLFVPCEAMDRFSDMLQDRRNIDMLIDAIHQQDDTRRAEADRKRS